MTAVGPLANRTALVTGGSRGIGRAVATGLAAAGADVVVAARTATDLAETAAEVERTGRRCLTVPTDVTDPVAVDALFDAIDAGGGIDIAVLNAGGIPQRGRVDGSDPGGWRDTFDLNVFAAYLCARAAIPRLRARGGGKILLVGSGLGHRGLADFAAYSCAKAAQWMLTRVLAEELRNEPISVNELVPGPVDTTIGTGRFNASGDDRFAAEWTKQPSDLVPLVLAILTLPDHGTSAQSFSLLRRDA